MFQKKEDRKANFILFLIMIAFSFPMVLTSCQHDNDSRETSEIHVDTLTNYMNTISIVPHYYEQAGHGKDTSYMHYLYLKGYRSEEFNFIDFRELCEKYIDTVTTYLPVVSISFYSSIDNFPLARDEQYWEIIDKDAIISVWLDREESKKRITKITSIIFYCDGKDYRVRF